jgi:cell division protease FtsH
MEVIDAKVKNILKDAYLVAIKLIQDNKELHEKITKDLLEKEEISEEEFKAYFK